MKVITKNCIKSKFINNLLKSGKKQKLEIELLKCFKSIQKSKRDKCSISIFKLSLKNSSPYFKLKVIKNKTRKNIIEIPYLLSEELRIFYGIKNLLNSVNYSKKISLYKRLNTELIKSSNLKGQSVKNKKLLHENAFLYRKYARYRWF